MSTPPDAIRLGSIRLLVLDVDGVLTDGRLRFTDRGETIKVFHAHDGYGIRRLLESGIEIAVISGRDSKATAVRLAELGISRIELGCRDKVGALHRIMDALNLSREAVAVMGDDGPDVAMMGKAGLAIAVADAHVSARAAADWITAAGGGAGAVREVCDALLAARSET